MVDMQLWPAGVHDAKYGRCSAGACGDCREAEERADDAGDPDAAGGSLACGPDAQPLRSR